ncbi:MAG: PspA/IM30 family protein, partial [Myxococcota bacterium]
HQVVEKLEKPELMLAQAIRDKEKQIREAKKAVQGCIATERQTKAMMEKERAQQRQWESKAETALKAGRDDLAVKALSRATEHEQKASSVETNWQDQRKTLDSLKQDITSFDDQLAEYKRNKDFIIAQSKAAEVKKSIYEARAKISKSGDVDNLMERMKAKAERTSYEADAAQEMAEMQTGGRLEAEFEGLEDKSVDGEVQAKLDALKAKIARA